MDHTPAKHDSQLRVKMPEEGELPSPNVKSCLRRYKEVDRVIIFPRRNFSFIQRVFNFWSRLLKSAKAVSLHI